jgi:tartrate dehydrogenase/decarboxylase/D-malate dehydrogenase
VGWPEIPDHVSLWGFAADLSSEFDRASAYDAAPHAGIIAPVVRRDGTPRQPGEIDFYIVRENTEGEYSSISGKVLSPGTEREFV